MSFIFLASGNPGKLYEIQAILSGTNWEVVTPGRLELELEVEETGKTYAENAALKVPLNLTTFKYLPLRRI